MADTRHDVILPARQWVNLYAQSGITVGTAVSLYNKGSFPCMVVISAAQPTGNLMGVPLYVGSNGSFASVPELSSGLWGYSDNGSRILVQE